MSDLITRKLPNEQKIYLVKWLTQILSFNDRSITNWTQNKIIKIANTECLIQSLVNYLLQSMSTK